MCRKSSRGSEPWDLGLGLAPLPTELSQLPGARRALLQNGRREEEPSGIGRPGTVTGQQWVHIPASPTLRGPETGPRCPGLLVCDTHLAPRTGHSEESPMALISLCQVGPLLS